LLAFCFLASYNTKQSIAKNQGVKFSLQIVSG
jgi:hypothetical protein